MEGVILIQQMNKAWCFGLSTCFGREDKNLSNGSWKAEDCKAQVESSK
jgi:hypothetical protein